MVVAFDGVGEHAVVAGRLEDVVAEAVVADAGDPMGGDAQAREAGRDVELGAPDARAVLARLGDGELPLGEEDDHRLADRAHGGR